MSLNRIDKMHFDFSQYPTISVSNRYELNSRILAVPTIHIYILYIHMYKYKKHT